MQGVGFRVWGIGIRDGWMGLGCKVVSRVVNAPNSAVLVTIPEHSQHTKSPLTL